MLMGLDIGWGTVLAIKTLVVLAFIPLSALILGYVFLLKMMSHMQSRLGPMDPGGFHGWYQLVGDGVKFMQKEDIMPVDADRRVFRAGAGRRGVVDLPRVRRHARAAAPRTSRRSTSASSTWSRSRRCRSSAC